MSQATLIGLCSDNLITILTPSSTIECGNYENPKYVFDLSGSSIYVAPLTIPLSGPSLIIGTITPTLWPVTVSIGGFTRTVTDPTISQIPFQIVASGTSVILTVSAGVGVAVSYTVYRAT